MLLDVQDLQTYFYTRSGIVKAVDGVSFSVDRGETLGIVGESGSGKSVTVMSLLGLIPTPPGKVVGGQAKFAGNDLLQMSGEELRQHRGRRIAMIFQDPMTSLNPYLKVSTQLVEVLRAHDSTPKKVAYKRAIEALDQVGISEPHKRVDCYPHQFSGGMRQRVMIAMALIANPELLIADEPTTALDVTIQAQILELLKRLQKETGMGLILITHDLGVVAGMSDKILVMYAGKPVESGNADEIFYKTSHPYTLGLLQSVPKVTGDEGRHELYTIPGLPPDPAKLPVGCAFSPRCRYAMAVCRQDTAIPKRAFGLLAHQSVCHLEGVPS